MESFVARKLPCLKRKSPKITMSWPTLSVCENLSFNFRGCHEIRVNTNQQCPAFSQYIPREHVTGWIFKTVYAITKLHLIHSNKQSNVWTKFLISWKNPNFSDSMYTERFMGLPGSDNEEGYTTSRLSTMAEEFRGKNFYLIHGTLDDNVHYQQSMALARSLEQKDILFKQMVKWKILRIVGKVAKHFILSLLSELSRWRSQFVGCASAFIPFVGTILCWVFSFRQRFVISFNLIENFWP